MATTNRRPSYEHAYHAEAPKELPAYKLAVNQKPTSDAQALWDAAAKGDTKQVLVLLEAGANPNWFKHPEGGATALHKAAETSAACVRALLEHGAAVDERLLTSLNGPLHLACIKGSVEIATALVEAGAPVNTGNAYGNSPLFLAVSGGHKELAEYLLQKGADVAWANNRGSTPLHFAAYAVCPADTRADLCNMLLKAGADVNAADGDGMTALHIAARDGDADLAQLLLEKGAKQELLDIGNHNAAYYARFKNHKNLLHLLGEE